VPAANFFSLFNTSPNSIWFAGYSPGDGDPNRAYPTNAYLNDIDGDIPPYYEWRYDTDGKTRIVTYFMSYDYIDGKWRGVDQVGEEDSFEPDGEKIEWQ
jgi:hypothetical protein